MKEYSLYFATNRHHEGEDFLHPTGYGSGFSSDGHENLRFGYLTLRADEKRVRKFLKTKVNGRARVMEMSWRTTLPDLRKMLRSKRTWRSS